MGINVSTTRNILTNGGSSGAIIKAFGDFVVQGNVVVGLIIYLIIVLMQFIVITKGAERVSEVAARFKLDAMPGKQMAIDADLSSGMITEQQARERREKIQRESDFYGSMDGATKIVKGDGVMSLITTAINLVGGSIIGILQSGQPIGTVLSTYSIATVGDGLVGQIPSLLISVSTGMIVTRAVSEGSLNEDVSKQFTQQPRSMMITGIVMGVLMIIPGMLSYRFYPYLQALSLQAISWRRESKKNRSGQERKERDYFPAWKLLPSLRKPSKPRLLQNPKKITSRMLIMFITSYRLNLLKWISVTA